MAKCDTLTTKERNQNNQQVAQFAKLVFQSKAYMNLREFSDFNTNESSEMFLSVISVLQERLPCTSHIHSEKRQFRQTEYHKSLSLAKQEDDQELVKKTEEMCNSPLRAVAQPKLLTGMALNKSSTFKQTNDSAGAATKSSLNSSDFKVKKRVDKNLNHSSSSVFSSELADSDFEPERQESISRLIEDNKLRRLEDARLKWSKNHSTSSPFRQAASSLSQCSSASDVFQAPAVNIQNLKLSEEQSPLPKGSTFSKQQKKPMGIQTLSSFKRVSSKPRTPSVANSPTIRTKKTFTHEQ